MKILFRISGILKTANASSLARNGSGIDNAKNGISDVSTMVFCVRQMLGINTPSFVCIHLENSRLTDLVVAQKCAANNYLDRRLAHR